MSSGARRTRATASLEKAAKEAIDNRHPEPSLLQEPPSVRQGRLRMLKGPKTTRLSLKPLQTATESGGLEEEPIEVVEEAGQ